MTTVNLDITNLFRLGMKRELGDLKSPDGFILNLGAGNSHIPGTTSLDLPAWNADHDPIPYGDGSANGIFAFHFFEHLTGVRAIATLMECQRVLRPGGLLTIVVPHYLGLMAYQDLDHKSFWSEETIRTLMRNPYYDKNREVPWLFTQRFSMIAGVVSRNLCQMIQLERIAGGE